MLFVVCLDCEMPEFCSFFSSFFVVFCSVSVCTFVHVCCVVLCVVWVCFLYGVVFDALVCNEDLFVNTMVSAGRGRPTRRWQGFHASDR